MAATRLTHLALMVTVLMTAVIGPVASHAQPDTRSAAPSNAPSLTADEVTELSGLTITLKKPEPTELSGLTVTVRRPTPLSDVTVTLPKCPPARSPAEAEGPAPKLLSAYPAREATVRRGIVILRLTFDRPMTCEGLLDLAAGYPNPCPAPLTNPLFSRDRRTFLTVCVVGDGQDKAQSDWRKDKTAVLCGGCLVVYRLRLDRFTSLSGKPLEPLTVEFKVDPASRPVRTMKEAMAQDTFLRNAQKAAERAQAEGSANAR